MKFVRPLLGFTKLDKKINTDIRIISLKYIGKPI
jgi:hypothetical protein